MCFSKIGYLSPARNLLLQVLSFLIKVLTANRKLAYQIFYCTAILKVDNQIVHGTSCPVNCGCCGSGLVKLPGVKTECKGFLASQFQNSMSKAVNKRSFGCYLAI
jgi:hypothetical protein